MLNLDIGMDFILGHLDYTRYNIIEKHNDSNFAMPERGWDYSDSRPPHYTKDSFKTL